MDDKRCPVWPDLRSLLHPEEILETRRSPWWPSLLVMDLNLTPILETNAVRSDLVEDSGVKLLFKHWHKVLGGGP